MLQEQIIAESIDYLVAHYDERRPDLAFLAKRAGYEATHFQKLFKEHVGISPKRLCQYMHMREAREMLEARREHTGYRVEQRAFGDGAFAMICLCLVKG